MLAVVYMLLRPTCAPKHSSAKLDSCAAGPPKILHYGNDLSVNGTGYTFSKIALRQAGFDATMCPAWDAGQGKLRGGLLPYPPSPLSLTSQVRLGCRVFWV